MSRRKRDTEGDCQATQGDSAGTVKGSDDGADTLWGVVGHLIGTIEEKTKGQSTLPSEKVCPLPPREPGCSDKEWVIQLMATIAGREGKKTQEINEARKKKKARKAETGGLRQRLIECGLQIVTQDGKCGHIAFKMLREARTEVGCVEGITVQVDIPGASPVVLSVVVGQVFEYGYQPEALPGSIGELPGSRSGALGLALAFSPDGKFVHFLHLWNETEMGEEDGRRGSKRPVGLATGQPGSIQYMPQGFWSQPGGTMFVIGLEVYTIPVSSVTGLREVHLKHVFEPRKIDEAGIQVGYYSHMYDRQAGLLYEIVPKDEELLQDAYIHYTGAWSQAASGMVQSCVVQAVKAWARRLDREMGTQERARLVKEGVSLFMPFSVFAFVVSDEDAKLFPSTRTWRATAPCVSSLEKLLGVQTGELGLKDALTAEAMQSAGAGQAVVGEWELEYCHNRPGVAVLRYAVKPTEPGI